MHIGPKNLAAKIAEMTGGMTEAEKAAWLEQKRAEAAAQAEARYQARMAAEQAQREAWAKESHNFGQFDEDKIRKIGREWSKGGHIRFYIGFDAACEMAGIKLERYKSGAIKKIAGMSNQKGYKMQLAWESSRPYFDAVKGNFHFGSAGSTELAEDLEDACLLTDEEQAKEAAPVCETETADAEACQGR